MRNKSYELVVSDYVNLRLRLAELGCSEPKGLTILPSNLASARSTEELIQPMESATIKKLLLLENLPYTDISRNKDRPKYVTEKSSDLILPTIFVSGALLTQNPQLVSLAVNIVANYATDFFKGMSGERKVKMNFVSETAEGGYKNLSFEGPPQAMPEVIRLFEELINE